jgi:D-alanyl-D-alanine carboxypeptidase
MRRAITLTSALALLFVTLLAPMGKATAQDADTSPEAMPATWDELLQNGLDRGLTGIALRVEQGDEVIFEGAAGFANVEAQTVATVDDKFRIASATKPFTAVLILQLVEEGVLTLDDTVSQWLDDPVVSRIPNVDRITIRQLLNHTSGVYDYFDEDSPFWQDAYFGEGADWSRVWTPQELLAYVDGEKHAPYFAPGERSYYSNTGYVLLGLILEQATGMRYADLLHAQITEPLGLTDTYFAATEAVPGGLTEAYHLIEGNPVNVSPLHLSRVWTAAGIVSTTRDLSRFIDALLGGELLKPATLDEAMTFSPSNYPGFEVGLGVGRWHTSAGDLVGHGGDGAGAGVRIYRLPEADLTVVLLTNMGGNDAVLNDTYIDAFHLALSTVAANG